MIHSITHWNFARRPNYKINTDKLYPYSEVPYIGNYHLIRLPVSETLVDHVDYWGEGRINASEGSSGFPDCYNVNHQYQLVSNGPDTNKKIPNRIPVISYTNCDTSSYIKDDSVKLVTLMGAPINKSCAKDIARMVNGSFGKVVVYGFKENSADVRNLTEELVKKDLLHVPAYALPDYLKGLTIFDSHKAYLNKTDLSEVLHNNITDGFYDNAVAITKSLAQYNKSDIIRNMVSKLLQEGKKNIMTYAYKLWVENEKDIVKNNFPETFKLILDETAIKIWSKNHNVSLKLNDEVNNPNEKLAFVEVDSDNSNTWKFEPIYENNEVFFKIKSVDFNIYLKIDKNEGTGNQKANAGSNAVETNFLWVLSPLQATEHLFFLIINRQTNQGLKLDDSLTADGTKQLFAQEISVNDQQENFGWLIEPVNKIHIEEYSIM